MGRSKLIETSANMIRVAVVYTHMPHYRQAVFKRLMECKTIKFEFYFGDTINYEGIKSSYLDGIVSYTPLCKRKNIIWQGGLFKAILLGGYDAIIFLGNPNILSTWFYAGLARFFFGIHVSFWTHGWIKVDTGFKKILRLMFYSIANDLMLYGNRAIGIGVSLGVPFNKMHFIANSLNVDEQRFCRYNLLGQYSELRSLYHSIQLKKYFLVVSRLVSTVHIDQAIRAMAIVGNSYSLVVIGSGPDYQKLKILADELEVDVKFVEECYDEKILSSYFIHATAVISPGKVGLLAMHSMAYGCAVITHGDADHQMPEFEALEKGISGFYFIRGDFNDLARCIINFIEINSFYNYKIRFERSIKIIDEIYNPDFQVNSIVGIILKRLCR